VRAGEARCCCAVRLRRVIDYEGAPWISARFSELLRASQAELVNPAAQQIRFSRGWDPEPHARLGLGDLSTSRFRWRRSDSADRSPRHVGGIGRRIFQGIPDIEHLLTCRVGFMGHSIYRQQTKISGPLYQTDIGRIHAAQGSAPLGSLLTVLRNRLTFSSIGRRLLGINPLR